MSENYEPVNDVERDVEGEGGANTPLEELKDDERGGLEQIPLEEIGGIGREGKEADQNHQNDVDPAAHSNAEEEMKNSVSELTICFTTSWTIFCLNLGKYTGVAAMWLILYVVFEIIAYNIAGYILSIEPGKAPLTWLMVYEGQTSISYYLETILFKIFLALIPKALIMAPGITSAFLAILESIRNEHLISEDFTRCYRDTGMYIRSVKLGAVIFLLAGVTWCLYIVPCLFLMPFTFFAVPLYLERPTMGIYGAVARSSNVVWDNRRVVLSYSCMFLGLNMLILTFTTELRALLLITIPVAFTMSVNCYNNLFRSPAQLGDLERNNNQDPSPSAAFNGEDESDRQLDSFDQKDDMATERSAEAKLWDPDADRRQHMQQTSGVR